MTLDFPVSAHHDDQARRVCRRPIASVAERKTAPSEEVRFGETIQVNDPSVGLGGFVAKDVHSICLLVDRRRLLRLARLRASRVSLCSEKSTSCGSHAGSFERFLKKRST